LSFGGSNPVAVYAAAGTAGPVRELSDSYTKKTGIQIDNNFASSGTLAKQITNGAEAEIFISANEQWITYLKSNGLLKEGTVQKICSNSLALITQKDSGIKVELSKNYEFRKINSYIISIGDPGYVPVGKYTKQVFDSLGWFGKLQDNFILAKDVSSVLKYVELGEADLGIVYSTEAALSDKVKILQIIPQTLHEPINFYIAIVKGASAEAENFYRYILGNEGKDLFKRKGFIVEDD
jgi:molybdate transport system substrate-binding protein